MSRCGACADRVSNGFIILHCMPMNLKIWAHAFDLDWKACPTRSDVLIFLHRKAITPEEEFNHRTDLKLER
jgi:hypothetical protein